MPVCCCCSVSPTHPPALFQALDQFNIEKDIAAHIKKEFDKKYNPTWHCIVGTSSPPTHPPTHASSTHPSIPSLPVHE